MRLDPETLIASVASGLIGSLITAFITFGVQEQSLRTSKEANEIAKQALAQSETRTGPYVALTQSFFKQSTSGEYPLLPLSRKPRVWASAAVPQFESKSGEKLSVLQFENTGESSAYDVHIHVPYRYVRVSSVGRPSWDGPVRDAIFQVNALSPHEKMTVFVQNSENERLEMSGKLRLEYQDVAAQKHVQDVQGGFDILP